MKRTACFMALVAGTVACSSVASGQDDPTVDSAAALLERLRQAGVEIPAGYVINGDGSVTVPGDSQDDTGEGSGVDDVEEEDVVGDAAGESEDEGGDAAPDAEDLDKAEWDTKLNLGLNLSSGNTEQLGYSSTIVSTRKTDDTKLTLDAGYFYSSQDGDKTSNKFTAGVNNDWLLPDSRWLYFAGSRYDWDEFRSFDHRVSANGGVGYEIVKREKLKVTLRGGAGFYKEFGSDRNELVPEGLLGADVNWDIADNQGFELSTRLFPDLSDQGEFRWLTTAGWNLDIDVEDGLSFNISLIHEYISDVDPGVENSDLQLFAGLSYDF